MVVHCHVQDIATYSQDWMDAHVLPTMTTDSGCPPIDLLEPFTTYVVKPSPEACQEKGMTWQQANNGQAAALITREMLLGVKSYVDALNSKGFKHNAIGIDVDGKRKLVRNSWELLTFGSRTLHKPPGKARWTLTFMPFLVVLVPTESWFVLTYGYLALEEAVWRAFGISISFVAQNTDAHSSAMKAAKVMEIEVNTMCYPHVVRGPSDMRQRSLVKGKNTKEKEAWLAEHAQPDVTMIHLCQTTAQVRAHTPPSPPPP